MATTGIRRKIDDLGRVVIPAGIRRSLDMREGDAVDVSVDGDRVVLAKPTDRCVFCGTEDDPLHTFRSRRVCGACIASVGMLDGRQDPPTGGDPTTVAARGPARHLAPTGEPRWARPAVAGPPAETSPDERPTDEPPDDHPPYDPASTTAW